MILTPERRSAARWLSRGHRAGARQCGAGSLKREPVVYRNREQALSEELDQTTEPSAVRSDLHRPHRNVSLSGWQIRGNCGQPATIPQCPERAGAYRVGCRVGAAAGQHAHPFGPVRLVIVQNGAGPHRSHPARAVHASGGRLPRFLRVPAEIDIHRRDLDRAASGLG